MSVLKLYKEMSELTGPLCEKKCHGPQKCCSQEYCLMTIEHARNHYNKVLKPTNHPTLPMMGSSGCIAEPHFRPLCTVHICEYTLMKQSQEIQNRYDELREKISEEDITLR